MWLEQLTILENHYVNSITNLLALCHRFSDVITKKCSKRFNSNFVDVRLRSMDGHHV